MKLGKGKTAGENVSFLGKGTEIIGDITFSGSMEVAGVIKGTVHSESSLLVEPSGFVDAEVHVRRAVINGEFRGLIRAADRVEIQKEGKVFGDIYSPCLIIEAGATFEGSCNMGDGEQNSGTAAQTVKETPSAVLPDAPEENS